MDDKHAERIIQTLEVIQNLLAHQVATAYDTLSEKAVALASLGLGRNDIASVCHATPESISVRLAEAKRRTRKSKRHGTKAR